MKYLVMECHLSYAVVMDGRGRFLKVANQHFEVGQCLDRVVPMAQPEKRSAPRLGPLLAAAACLCLVILSFWQMALLNMGTVLIQINPQIRLCVNRLERVISAEALNADGAALLFEYDPAGKPVEQAVWELSGRAAELGYLTDGGEVHLQVRSENARWKAETEQRLETVQSHLSREVTVRIEPEDWTPAQTTQPEIPDPPDMPTFDCDEDDDGPEDRDDDWDDWDDDDGDDDPDEDDDDKEK